jgi:hypothetical protein
MSDPARSRRAPSVVSEAFTLPVLLLTVALGGGVRATGSGGLRFLAPSLMALVLSLLLLGVLVRARAISIPRLIGADRPALANANGALILLALFAAGAQLFNCLTPETGLLAFAGNIFFFVLLWNTLAADPDASRLLRSLVVIFGAAFILKYVLLAALYDPDGGLTRRVLATLLEGVTLGGLSYQPHAPLTGYVAFSVVLLYLFALLLLPRPFVLDEPPRPSLRAPDLGPHRLPEPFG